MSTNASTKDRVSESEAQYLLLSGLVPCENSGKKTRNFKVKVDDIIKYLEDREVNPDKYKMPSKHRFWGNKEKLQKYYEENYDDYPDVVGVSDIERMTGLGKSSIVRWLRSGEVMSFKVKNAYKVPKDLIIQFIVDNKSSRVNVNIAENDDNIKEMEEIVI